MDALSQMFGSFRVEKALCTRFEVTAPWGHRVTHRGQIKFVLVVDGSCWLRTRALEEPTLLSAHDLFLVLDGEPYTLSDAPNSKSVDCGSLEPLRDGYLIKYGGGRHGGGGARTTLVSVAIDVDAAESESLLLALPPFIHLGVDHDRSHGLQSLIEVLRREVTAAELGSVPIVRRLAEALVISAVRSYLQKPDRPRQGVLAAIGDAQLGRALDEMYGDVAHPWTIESLARSARMSRSSFAAKFRSAVGHAPLEHLTQLRMDRARALLRGGVAIADVAARVGYESSVSFTRAFGRVTGRTPGAFKRGIESGDGGSRGGVGANRVA